MQILSEIILFWKLLNCFYHKKRSILSDKGWVGVEGSPKNIQGFLYGRIGINGKITGNHAAYIYPRSNLALVGKFQNNQMKSAQKAIVEKVLCQNNILTIEFGKLSGPHFHLSISTNASIGDMPLVQDPYEANTVTIKKSSLPNSGIFHILCWFFNAIK